MFDGVTARLCGRSPLALVDPTTWRFKLAEGTTYADGEKIDAETPYLEHISKLVDLQAIKDSGLNVVVDSMYGAGSGLFARLLKGGKTRITEIHSERNAA